MKELWMSIWCFSYLVEIGTESVRHRDIAHGATKVGFYETLLSHRGVL